MTTLDEARARRLADAARIAALVVDDTRRRQLLARADELDADADLAASSAAHPSSGAR
jgi:hypothetical protein